MAQYLVVVHESTFDVMTDVDAGRQAAGSATLFLPTGLLSAHYTPALRCWQPLSLTFTFHRGIIHSQRPQPNSRCQMPTLHGAPPTSPSRSGVVPRPITN